MYFPHHDSSRGMSAQPGCCRSNSSRVPSRDPIVTGILALSRPFPQLFSSGCFSPPVLQTHTESTQQQKRPLCSRGDGKPCTLQTPVHAARTKDAAGERTCGSGSGRLWWHGTGSADSEGWAATLPSTSSVALK